jgi:hypothetical protein
LDRGRAQGDNISPNTFNFGEQILILKIELDPNSTGIWQSFQIPPYIASNSNPLFMHESRGETTKNESLADDNTTLLELTENNLFTLRESLEKFGDISGLRCNYDKTLVVPIGTNTVIPNNLHGFTVSNKIKLLGLEISNDLNLLTENFVVIRDKIVSLVLFWERFKLTLPGRIAIIKTLLLR